MLDVSREHSRSKTLMICSARSLLVRSSISTACRHVHIERIMVGCEVIFFAQSTDTSRKYVNARAVTSRTCVGANGSLKISQRAKQNEEKLSYHLRIETG